MTVNMYKSEKAYIVVTRAFNLEKTISYLFLYLKEEEARSLANKFANYLLGLGELPFATIAGIYNNERERLEEIYADNGKGIAYIERKDLYAIYYQYVDGPSPVMRMAFGKKEFGENRAYKLAHYFNMKFFLLKKTKKKLRDTDIENIVIEFDRLKLKNKYNNYAKKRRKTLKRFRSGYKK